MLGTPPLSYSLPKKIVDSLDEAVYTVQDASELHHLILELALEYLDVSYGSLRLLNHRTGQLEMQAFYVSEPGQRAAEGKFSDLSLEGEHIVSHVARTKRPLRIDHLSQSDWLDVYHPLGSDVRIESELVVPFLSNDKQATMGILNVESPQVEAFDKEDVLFLQALAHRAMLTIQQFQLSEAIHTISQMVLASDVDNLLDYTLEMLCSLMQVPVSSIWLWDVQEETFLLQRSIGRQQPIDDAPDLKVNKDSFLGQVIKLREPVLASNVLEEENFVYTELAKSENWLSTMAVPILSAAGDLLGVTSVYSVKEERQFTPFDIALSKSFSNQVAVALKHIQLLRQQEQELKLKATVQAVNDAIIQITEQDKLLTIIAEQASTLLDGEGAIIYLINDSLEQVVVAATTNSFAAARHLRTNLHGSLSGWVAQNNKGDICRVNDERIDQSIAQAIGLKDVVAAPLSNDKEVIGAIVVGNYSGSKDGFDRNDLVHLETIASQVTLGINRLRIYKKALQRQAQLGVVNDILTKSSQSTDIDELLNQAAIKISDALCYKVDIGLIENKQVTLRSTAYCGQVTLEDKICSKRTFTFDEGIIGWVAKNRRPKIVPDVTVDENYYCCYSKTKSEMAIPMMSHHEIRGVLNIESDEYGAFSEEDSRLFETISSGLMMAMENAQRLQEVTTLYKISDSVSKAEDLKHMLSGIVKAVANLFNGAASSLFLLEPAHNRLRLEVDYKLPSTIRERVKQLAPGESIAGKVLTDGVPIFIQDMVADPRADKTVTEEDNIRSLVSVPIKANEKILGALCLLTNEERHFLEHEINLLETIGTNVGLAIERAQVTQNYWRLYHSARDAIVTVSLDGAIVEANAQMQQLTGYPKSALLGQEISSLAANPADKIVMKNRVKAISNAKEEAIREIQILHQGGHIIEVESNPTAITDDNGEVYLIQSIWRDISERKENEAAIRRQNRQLQGLLELSRLSFDNLSIGQLVHKAQQKAQLLLGSQVCRIKHSFSDDHERFHTLDRLMPTGQNPLALLEQKVLTNKEGCFENDVPWFNGIDDAHGTRHLMAVPLILQEQSIGVISLMRVAAPAAKGYTTDDLNFLESMANNLALSIGYVRLNQIQRKQQSAQQVLKHMDLVGAFLVHKLGGFLGAISFNIDELRKHLKSSDPVIMKFLDVLGNVSETAAYVVQQFNNMGKPLEANREPVDIRTVIDNAIHEARPPDNIQTKLVYWSKVPALANRKLLQEVFVGVIHNAVDAMPSGGQLIIQGRASLDNEIIVEFNDSGSGIPLRYQKDIFSPFFSTKKKNKGMGIGLWLSKLYLQTLGGDIHVRSAVNEGTTIMIQLPSSSNNFLQKRLEKKSEQISFQKPKLSKKANNILVVEDDFIWQQTLQMSLQRRHLQFDLVDNFYGALNQLNSDRFDAFIVDIRLVDYDTKNMEGLMFVRKILEKQPDANILILSAWPESLKVARGEFNQFPHVSIVRKGMSKNLEQILDTFRGKSNDKRNYISY